MAITNLEELVNDGQPVSQQEIDAHQEGLRTEALSEREVRAEAEMEFAVAREEIDAKYAKALEQAETRRTNAHAKNLDKREKAFEKLGLNPNGSDPRGREQGVL